MHCGMLFPGLFDVYMAMTNKRSFLGLCLCNGLNFIILRVIIHAFLLCFQPVSVSATSLGMEGWGSGLIYRFHCISFSF